MKRCSSGCNGDWTRGRNWQCFDDVPLNIHSAPSKPGWAQHTSSPKPCLGCERIRARKCQPRQGLWRNGRNGAVSGRRPISPLRPKPEVRCWRPNVRNAAEAVGHLRGRPVDPCQKRTPTIQTVGTVPPSITYSVPVIEAARGDTRKAMRSATSFGFAGRPSGMPPRPFMMICLPPS